MDNLYRNLNLHSSMDRLETRYYFIHYVFRIFIYIPVWIDQKHIIKELKHQTNLVFTFQYGQIRNACKTLLIYLLVMIYIPVWIDQKHILYFLMKYRNLYLHSSMDRLETWKGFRSSRQKQIYIPVWIDQKLVGTIILRM